jgi:hypothetical protein
MRVRHLYHLAVFAALIGCASSGSPDTGTAPRKGNLLTSMEMATAHADVASAYDAVARLRPNWLAPHGVTSGLQGGAGTDRAVVFVDGQQYGDMDSLRNIQAYQVDEIRYYDVTQAGARFGIRGGSGGAIEVRLKNAQR